MGPRDSKYQNGCTRSGKNGIIWRWPLSSKIAISTRTVRENHVCFPTCMHILIAKFPKGQLILIQHALVGWVHQTTWEDRDRRGGKTKQGWGGLVLKGGYVQSPQVEYDSCLDELYFDIFWVTPYTCTIWYIQYEISIPLCFKLVPTYIYIYIYMTGAPVHKLRKKIAGAVKTCEQDPLHLVRLGGEDST